MDSTRIVQKNKFHIYSHLPEHVARFGVPVLFSTERYESFNHLFRQCSVYSNKQSPSRDIAAAFATYDTVRFILQRGEWKNRERKIVTASTKVLDCLEKYKNSHHLLATLAAPNEPMSRTSETGRTTLERRIDPKHPNKSVSWRDTIANLISSAPRSHEQTTWHKCSSVVVANGDKANIGSHVLFKERMVREIATIQLESKHLIISKSISNEGIFGEIKEILKAASTPFASLSDTSSSGVVIVVAVAEINGTTHASFSMPVLKISDGMRVVAPKVNLLSAYRMFTDAPC